MSSILDALSKVDQADPDRIPSFQLPTPPPQRPRPARWIFAAMVAATITGGWELWRRNTVVAPQVAAPVTVTTQPIIVAPVSPPPSGLAVVGAIEAPPPVTGEQPWIRTTVAAPPTPPSEAPVVVAPPPLVTPPTTPPPTLSPAARGVLVAPKPDLSTRPAALPEPPPGTEALAGVRISFLAYSRDPNRRTVSLALEGGSLLTLREGQHEGDLEVTRIYPDRVDLIRAGAPFTVRARD